MTTIAVTLSVEAAYIVSDGLATDGSGAGMHLCSKVLPMPHLRAAVAVRGHAIALTGMWTALSGKPSLEGAAAGLGASYRLVIEHLHKLGFATDQPCDACLVGWPSGALNPACWYVSDRARPGCEAFEAQSVLGFTPDVSRCSPRIQALAAAACDPFDTTGRYIPQRDGPDLIDAMRAIPEAATGCMCQLTTITQDAITTEVLREWPEDMTRGPLFRSI